MYGSSYYSSYQTMHSKRVSLRIRNGCSNYDDGDAVAKKDMESEMRDVQARSRRQRGERRILYTTAGGDPFPRARGSARLLLLELEYVQVRVVRGLRLAVRAARAVRPCEVLSVVHGEVQVVERVMRRPVDDLLERVAGNEVRVVDEDRPEVDEDEEAEVQVPVERQDENEGVVRYRLQIAVERVECVRCERSGDDPLVVRLVDMLVECGVVLQPVDPIYAEIGQKEESGTYSSGAAVSES
jgi:hypothetical protein